MVRVVEPEILDDLPPDAPAACASRSDLIRLNRIMRHAPVLNRLLPPDVTCVVDAGGGDGTLLLSLVRRNPGRWKRVVLVDRQRIIHADTLNQFRKLNIDVEVEVADIFEFLQRPRIQARAALMANLFLHHFGTAKLTQLLTLAASACDVFIACEPRRGIWPAFAARLLGLIGCHQVTRHDAIVSVRAGFNRHELTMLWPAAGWKTAEFRALLFSHVFVATRL